MLIEGGSNTLPNYKDINHNSYRRCECEVTLLPVSRVVMSFIGCHDYFMSVINFPSKRMRTQTLSVRFVKRVYTIFKVTSSVEYFCFCFFVFPFGKSILHVPDTGVPVLVNTGTCLV